MQIENFTLEVSELEGMPAIKMAINGVDYSGLFWTVRKNCLWLTVFNYSADPCEVIKCQDVKDLYKEWNSNFCKKWMCLANQLRAQGRTGSEAMKEARAILIDNPHLIYIQFEKAKDGEGTGVITGRVIDPTKHWTEYSSPKGSGRKLKKDQKLVVDFTKTYLGKYPLISYYTYLLKDRAA